MTKKLPEDTKLLSLPTGLVNRLKDASIKRGTNISAFAAEALEETLRAESLGATTKDAVDAFEMREIQRGGGAMVVTRDVLSQLVESDEGGSSDELAKLWMEAGNWYGHYLSSKLGSEEVVPFLEKDLRVSWNLDEVEFTVGDGTALLKFTCFMMSERFTHLLLSYVSGVMRALGYRDLEGDHMRGMASVRFGKAPKDVKL